MLLLWTENLRVGIEEFDEDHKKLIALVNRLHGAIQAGTSREILGGVLNALEHHAFEHCRCEEMLLMQAGYPEAAEHMKEHNQLRRMIAGLKLRQQSGSDSDLSTDLMNLLYIWITNHVYSADRRSSEFMRAAGVLHLLPEPVAPAHAASRATPAQFLASDAPGASHDAIAHSERMAPMIASESMIGTSIQRAASILRATKASSTPNP